MDTYTHAYIYLIREREFLLRAEPVFKLGRGAQNPDRVIKRIAKGYKKGSEIWLTIRCPIYFYKDVETSLIKTFRQRFEKYRDGNEYFSGDPLEMMKVITDAVQDSWLTEKTRNAGNDAFGQIMKKMMTLTSELACLQWQNDDLVKEKQVLQEQLTRAKILPEAARTKS